MPQSKYYKMESYDPTSVRLESFPQSAVLGTDSEGNIQDVSSQMGKVKVNTNDPASGYLEDKLADTVDIDWTPKTDNSALESIIYQLTGRGAAISKKTVLDAVQLALGNTVELTHPQGPGISGFTTGRGCTVGRVYKKDPVTNTKKQYKAWIAQSSNGTLFTTLDNFATAIEDLSLKTYDTANGNRIGSPYRYGCHAIAYTKKSGVSVWAVFTQGYTGYYYIEDIAANYNDDGTFVSSAWQWYTITGIGNFDATAHTVNIDGGGIFATSSYLEGVAYSADLLTWVKCASMGEEVSGISKDSYGTYIAIGRNTGTIYRNESERLGTFSSTAWSPLTGALGLRVDGKTVDHLPINGSGGGLSQTWWAGVGCAYGLWVITAANRPDIDLDPIYAYSNDGVNWYTYGQGQSGLIRVWDMMSDGVFFYGCPADASSPLVYQVIVNSIPAHKRLIAEEGIMVSSNAFLADMPNATSLGTDENGKIVAKFDTTSPSKKYYTTAPDVVRGDSSNIMAVSATFNGVDTVGWTDDEIIELEYHMMMVPLELNGSLTSGGSKVVNVAGPPRQVFFLLENTSLNTAGILQVQGLMYDRASAETSVDKVSKRPYKVTLELEKKSTDIYVRGGTVSIPYYVSGTIEKEGILTFGYMYSNDNCILFHPSAVPGSKLEGAFDHFTIGLNLDWLGELALTGCEVFSSAFIEDSSLTSVLEVNRIKKGA